MSHSPGTLLEDVLRDEGGTLTLIAPFIKQAALRRVLELASFDDLVVYTRWMPAEVAQGVSDLEVLDDVRDAGGRLHLLSDLHAKAFLTPSRALVGSANITAAALGWSQYPNVELLLEVERDHPALQHLLWILESASTAATDGHRDEIAAIAGELRDHPDLLAKWHSEFLRTESELASAPSPQLWVPQTTDPVGFLEYHLGRRRLIRSAEERADRDLAHLQVQVSPDLAEFKAAVRDALQRTGIFNTVWGTVDAGHGDDVVYERFCDAVGLSSSDPTARRYWEIATAWLLFFFPEQFEMRSTGHTFGRRPTDYGTYG